MYKVWKDCCLKAGLDEPSEKHGLDLQAGNEAGAYVAKWGLEHEMTKGHIKRARKITAPVRYFEKLYRFRKPSRFKPIQAVLLCFQRYTPVELVKRS